MNAYTAEDFERAYAAIRGAGRVVLEGNDLLLLLAALRIAARCAAAGLLSDPPTAWIAPMRPTDAMIAALYDVAEFSSLVIEWDAMRDAYLEEQSGK